MSSNKNKRLEVLGAKNKDKPVCIKSLRSVNIHTIDADIINAWFFAA